MIPVSIQIPIPIPTPMTLIKVRYALKLGFELFFISIPRLKPVFRLLKTTKLKQKPDKYLQTFSNLRFFIVSLNSIIFSIAVRSTINISINSMILKLLRNLGPALISSSILVCL